MGNEYDVADKLISRAVGSGLRQAREIAGWSRLQLVVRLPSGIGDRTLLSYEHGTRHLTVIRFIEICRVLGVAPPLLLTQALQRARLELSNLVLQVDLRALIDDRNDKFRPMVQWARNKLNRFPDGIVEIKPSSVEELADFVGYSYQELVDYLARFTPDLESVANAQAGARPGRW